MELAAQEKVLVKIEPWDTESAEDAPSIPVFIKDEPPSVEVRSSCLDVSVKEEILNTEVSCSNATEIPLDEWKVERVKEECGGSAVSPTAAAPSNPVLLKVKPLSDGSVEFWFSCMDEPVKEEINTEASCSNGIETPLDETVKVERVKEECGVSASEGMYDDHSVTDKLMLGPIPVERRNIKTEGRAPQVEQGKSVDTYRCEQCSFTTTRKCGLGGHMRIHARHNTPVYKTEHTEKPYKSDLRTYAPARKSSLLIHKKRHTGENQYKCSKCSYTTPRESELISHEIVHIGETPHKSDDKLSNEKYKCGQCNFTTTLLRSLKCHERSHNGEKQDTCRQDRAASSDNSESRGHEETHAGRAPQEEQGKSVNTYRCDHCPFTTVRKSALVSHMRVHIKRNTPVCKTEHTEKPYKCSQCSFSAVSKSYLISHVMTHTGDKRFKCDQCSFVGRGKYGLQAHKRVHEKPYKCGHCSYASNHGNNLKQHERTHVREKEYRCDQCDFFASKKQSVNLHKRHVHSQKSFKCSLCNYSTALEYSLLLHKKRHTGENQYKCSKCSYTTPRESELISHEIVHIGETPHKSDDKLGNDQYKCGQCNFTTILLRSLRCHENIHNGEKQEKCGQDRVDSSDNNKLSDHEKMHTEASFTSTSLTVEH